MQKDANDHQTLSWLGRETRAGNFTSIIQSTTKAKVISIEAGFGFGKTIFAKKWAALLRERGETVIEFDSWQADHSNDPLLTFTGKLLENLPTKPEGPLPKGSKREKALKGFGTVAKVVSVAGAKAAAGSFGAAALAEWLNVEKDSEEEALIEEITKAAGGSASKQLITLLVGQATAEQMRTQDLPAQLQALLHELESDKTDQDRKGRIVVIIDELDRCRPDYAIAMLEAIKHLFHQEGYIFVLMINPEQIERTAGRLYGKIDNGEPYFTKFIDLRLELGLPDYQELAEHLCQLLTGKFTPLTKSPDMNVPKAAEWFAKCASHLSVTPRQMAAATRHTDVSIALAKGRKIDPAYLLCASLIKVSSQDNSVNAAQYLPWIDFGLNLKKSLEDIKKKLVTPSSSERRNIRASFISKTIGDLRVKGMPLVGETYGGGVHYDNDNLKISKIEEAAESAEVYREFLPSLIDISAEIQVD